MSVQAGRQAARAWCALMAVATAAIVAACSEIGTSVSEPAAIEFESFVAPAVVLGDSLRDFDGVATPAHAIVRNVQGDIIADAHVLYIYADVARDTALAIDSLTGFVRALKAFKTGFATGRLAARAGTSLQLIRTLEITTRPDSADRQGQTAIDTLKTTAPDTGRSGASANTSVPLPLIVRHVASATDVTPVKGWLVKFVLVSPANATNDTTQGVYLVNESFRPSTIDTTDGTGTASRQVRVRYTKFPTGITPDSVVVQAIVRYKGVDVKGSPIRMVVPVRRK